MVPCIGSDAEYPEYSAKAICLALSEDIKKVLFWLVSAELLDSLESIEGGFTRAGDGGL